MFQTDEEVIEAMGPREPVGTAVALLCAEHNVDEEILRDAGPGLGRIKRASAHGRRHGHPAIDGRSRRLVSGTQAATRVDRYPPLGPRGWPPLDDFGHL